MREMKVQAYFYKSITKLEAFLSLGDADTVEIYDWECQAMMAAHYQDLTCRNFPVLKTCSWTTPLFYSISRLGRLAYLSFGMARNLKAGHSDAPRTGETCPAPALPCRFRAGTWAWSVFLIPSHQMQHMPNMVTAVNSVDEPLSAVDLVA